jgi:hypothetical protein
VRQRLARYGGIGAFLLGAGLQVSGVTNLSVGIALMAVGGLTTLGAFVGPWAFGHLAVAIVQAADRELGGTRNQPAAAVRDVRPIREAIQRVSGELRQNWYLLSRAQQTGHYWNVERQSLRADEWRECRAILAREPELEEAYRLAHTAFAKLDSMNHLLGERYDEESPVWRTVQAQDDLPGLVKVVDQAGYELREVLERLREPTGQGG